MNQIDVLDDKIHEMMFRCELGKECMILSFVNSSINDYRCLIKPTAMF